MGLKFVQKRTVDDKFWDKQATCLGRDFFGSNNRWFLLGITQDYGNLGSNNEKNGVDDGT